MSRDDRLSIILNRGWDAVQSARRFLADHEATSEKSGEAHDSGRGLDQLAHELSQHGENSAARIAYAIAFVMNGLADQTLRFDQDLATKTLQLISTLAGMLIELEATARVTIPEPVELIEELKLHSLSSNDGPCGTVVAASASSPQMESLTGIRHESEQLVRASESLLARILDDRESPYAPSVSSIHHLAKLVFNRVNSTQSPGVDERRTHRPEVHQPETSWSIKLVESVETETTANVQIAGHEGVMGAIEESNEFGPDPHSQSRISYQDSVPHPRVVLVIDESTFIRLLLTSAIESCGHMARTAANLDEARASCRSEEPAVIVTGETGSPNQTRQLQEWVQEVNQARPVPLIALMDDPNAVQIPVLECDHRIRRSDIAGLLACLVGILGNARHAVRKSA